MENPPLLQALARILSWRTQTLIAEAWDAGGLYQVSFRPFIALGEWNGRYRDDLREYLKEVSVCGCCAREVTGSWIFMIRLCEGREAIVNFINCP